MCYYYYFRNISAGISVCEESFFKSFESLSQKRPTINYIEHHIPTKSFPVQTTTEKGKNSISVATRRSITSSPKQITTKYRMHLFYGNGQKQWTHFQLLPTRIPSRPMLGRITHT
ncbi:hypothetical protein CDAR_234361 [Caerostris darwini]|uniref:Uncharacterized protein n=1 Tax=Caerostris darwini TaxID=1538125 RepID=A0AAV4QLW8_9ARAC|nr:hypothetical protein CDAR_234361 [Caerostris darwini]